ncbi:serine/threonine protein kinase [bacterium]|nr:serine/threonine protein kinase [bacterium]
MTQQNDLEGTRSRKLLRASAASFVRSAVGARRWLRQAIWIWPIVAGLLLTVVGYFTKQTIERSIREDLSSELSTLLEAEVAALRLWMKSQESIAASIANDPTASPLAIRLVEAAQDPSATQASIVSSKDLEAFRAEVGPLLEHYGYMDLLIADTKLRFVAGMKNELILQSVPDADQSILTERVFHGKRSVSAPRPSLVLLPDTNGTVRAGVATMFAWAPLSDAHGKIVAAVGIRIRPQDEFSKILSIGRSGKTGDTYAFNHVGTMVSMSRFEDDLQQIGILRPGEESTLTVALRDPGVDLTRGERPTTLVRDMPMTQNVALATKKEPGVNAYGYRSYRGVPVIGAWTWLDDYDIGITTEQELAEALAPVQWMKWFFWGLIGLLGLASLGIFSVTLFAARLDRKARLASLEVKRLGQYALDEKIGEGAMGVVYRAHHAMLHRPTAVKFLDLDKTNDQSITRFEREVQLTSQLTHPNTITIYDYGRTPEGVFYYAMELLEGRTLEDLVRRDGPVQYRRAIWFLRQICGSLAEAHEAGLIHRDVKPANLMVCTRGGVYDFIKVLDFGLARAVDSEKQSRLTAAGAIAGTPLYLSPEAIENPVNVDARADIYAVGAVAYYMLTGRPVFEGRSVMDILQMHIRATPSPPSALARGPIPRELDEMVLRCLAKDPAQRPASTRQMLASLDQWGIEHPWSQSDARQEAARSSPDKAEITAIADETTFLAKTELQ